MVIHIQNIYHKVGNTDGDDNKYVSKSPESINSKDTI